MDLFNTLAEALRPLKIKDQLHYSVQLPHALKTSTNYTVLLEKGHKIKVENGKIVNCDTLPTHEVNYFLGLGGGEFECHLSDLGTGEKLMIKI